MLVKHLIRWIRKLPEYGGKLSIIFSHHGVCSDTFKFQSLFLENYYWTNFVFQMIDHYHFRQDGLLCKLRKVVAAPDFIKTKQGGSHSRCTAFKFNEILVRLLYFVSAQCKIIIEHILVLLKFSARVKLRFLLSNKDSGINLHLIFGFTFKIEISWTLIWITWEILGWSVLQLIYSSKDW